MSRIVALAAALIACGGQTQPPAPDASTTDVATDIGHEAGDRCTKTIAQACTNLGWPCNATPDKIAVDWQSSSESCLFWDLGDWIGVGLSGPPDSDYYFYLFDAKTGALLEIDVSSWHLQKNFCLAGPPQPYPFASSSPPTRSCNTPCSLSTGTCSIDEEGRVCGPSTTVTSCGGSQQSFAECDCSSGTWSCTAADGGFTMFDSCDAGAD